MFNKDILAREPCEYIDTKSQKHVHKNNKGLRVSSTCFTDFTLTILPNRHAVPQFSVSNYVVLYDYIPFLDHIIIIFNRI